MTAAWHARGVYALLSWAIAAGGCSVYDPRVLDRPGASPSPGPRDSGSGGGAAGVSGAGNGGASAGTGGRAGTHAGIRDAAPPPRDAQGATDATSGDAAPDGGGDADAAQDASGSGDAACGEGAAAEDCCPDDPDKTEPGACGCGVADSDGDADGTPDCMDGCAGDPDKTAPGVCGCGRPDSDQGATASCAGLLSALRHRYRFDGTGTAVIDAQGDKDGQVINAQLDGSGQLALQGGTSDQYVDLPNGLVSALSDATFEVWVTWSGSGAGDWQRIFDFGSNSGADEGDQGSGRAYLFLTPSTSTDVLRAAYSVNGSGSETRVSASMALPSSGMHHVAVVFDDTDDELALYLDGALVTSTALSGSLSAISDVNNWLGRSQYSVDAELAGTLHEFRIYGAALSAAQIALSFADGPDPAYLEP